MANKYPEDLQQSGYLHFSDSRLRFITLRLDETEPPASSWQPARQQWLAGLLGDEISTNILPCSDSLGVLLLKAADTQCALPSAKPSALSGEIQTEKRDRGLIYLAFSFNRTLFAGLMLKPPGSEILRELYPKSRKSKFCTELAGSWG